MAGSNRVKILCLTVVFDHDIVDGDPATRFARRPVELIESGSGLWDNQRLVEVVRTEQAVVVDDFSPLFG
jgi:hypothetical protein